MIGLFKQDVVYDKIINLLYSENYDIRKQVIKALGDLKNKNAIPLLIEIYPKEDTQNKIEILKSIAKIGVYDYKTFILDAMSNPDIGIRIEAAKILLGDSIDTEDILTLIQDKYQDKEMHDILQHVMDNRNTI
jgi:HEAT repeat protein